MKFEELNRSHNREGFDCGDKDLNDFLKNLARQNLKKGLSRTFVLVDEHRAEEILGFYTLSVFEISAQELPSKHAKKYKGQLPAAKLVRLAVAIGKQSHGLGRYMIVNALKRVVTISENAGIVGFFVDAKNARVKDYYLKLGFLSLPEHPLELFLPLATIKQMNLKVFDTK